MSDTPTRARRQAIRGHMVTRPDGIIETHTTTKPVEYVYMFTKRLQNTASETQMDFVRNCTSAKAHLVLDIILRHMNTTNKCTMSQRTVANTMQVSQPAVHKLYTILQEHGMIMRFVADEGSNNSSYYMVNPYCYFQGNYRQWRLARTRWDERREQLGLPPSPERQGFVEQENS